MEQIKQVQCPRCEAVGCDWFCKGPYVWWFGIKFVVTPDVLRDMNQYYKELFAPTYLGRSKAKGDERWVSEHGCS